MTLKNACVNLKLMKTGILYLFVYYLNIYGNADYSVKFSDL